ncbi:MAG: hypothetical protein K0S33_197 [Bacteroidetes bacterium]|jgi:hypothetical protein|nr:hypothetical protein [Bacteroidota bacterium]
MKLSFTPFLIFLCLQGFAQTHCGSEQLRQELLKSNPSFRQQENAVEELIYRQTLLPANRDQQSVLTIPVVVHIIHQNGPENLTNAQVIAGIDQLNLRFQNAAPYTDATGTDIGIQFCLASVDPLGNPTTGITRNISPLTDLSQPGSSDLAMKNLNRWDPHLYLNIWIIKNTGSSTVAGYATYPSALASAAGIDGICIQYNYYAHYSLAHEAGHYLGLHHTFHEGCANTNCMLQGDKVCDTPPDASSDNTLACPANSCATEMDDTSGFNPFTSDVNEVPNYMDYTSCPLSFTPGQSARMNASLSQVRYELLQSNGCGQHPGGAIPTAALTFAQACGGTQLINISLNSVGAQWDFNSDGQIDDCGNSFTWNPPATGTYTVTIIAQGFGGQDTTTQTVFAQHYPYQNYPMINGFSGLNLSPVSGGFYSCGGTQVGFQGEPGMAHYQWSTGDTTQNLNLIMSGSTDLIISLITIDSAGLSWTTCYPVSIEARPAPIPPTISIDPNDTVFCTGGTADLLCTYSPIWSSGSLNYSGGNIPNFHNSIYTPTLNAFNLFSLSQTDANGCSASSNTITINAVSSPYPQTIIQAGGYLMYGPGIHFIWYLDGIPIPNSDNSMLLPLQTGCYTVFSWWSGPQACGTFALDTVCFVGINENILTENNVRISPNPVVSETTIRFDKEQKNTIVAVKDALGRELKSTICNGKELKLDMKDNSSGIYFIEIRDENRNVINKKVVIQ